MDAIGYGHFNWGQKLLSIFICLEYRYIQHLVHILVLIFLTKLSDKSLKYLAYVFGFIPIVIALLNGPIFISIFYKLLLVGVRFEFDRPNVTFWVVEAFFTFVGKNFQA